MNFNLYLFGKTKGAYSQYPDDYMQVLLSAFCSDVEKSKAVIHRDRDLVHYIFTDNLGNSNIIGICLIFNKTCIRHVGKLFNYLREIIESTLLKQGTVIRYNDSGDIEFYNSRLRDDTKTYEYIKTLINSKLDSEGNYFGISELTTIYNGLHNSGTVDENASDSEILEIQQKVNTISIIYNHGIENDFTKKLITGLQGRIEDLKNIVLEKNKQISKLERSKKQFKNLVLLQVVLLGACVGLYFLYTTLDRTTRELNATNENLSVAKNIIGLQSDSISSLNNTVVQQQNSIESLEYDVQLERSGKDSLQSTLNKFVSCYPFIVTQSKIDNFQYSFKYYCTEEKELTITIKAINENNSQIVTSDYTLTFYKGGGEKSLRFARTLDSSQFYYVVIIYNGQIIAGKRW